MHSRTFVLLTALALASAANISCARASAEQQKPDAPPADLVLTNGKIVTVEDAMPQAQAIALRGDRIQALGTSADMKRYVGPSTQVIDMQGQLAIPGFIEGHGHFSGVGDAQINLNLMTATSWA